MLVVLRTPPDTALTEACMHTSGRDTEPYFLFITLDQRSQHFCRVALIGRHTEHAPNAKKQPKQMIVLRDAIHRTRGTGSSLHPHFPLVLGPHSPPRSDYRADSVHVSRQASNSVLYHPNLAPTPRAELDSAGPQTNETYVLKIALFAAPRGR